MSEIEHDDIVEQALSKLDLDTKARILAGQDMWSLPAAPGVGLDAIVMSDGPIGVRGARWTADDPSIALPSPTALAATWDVALARRVGNLLAQEARRKGVHVLLAPTVNLHRSPLGGRHFECYSEDPMLSGEIAAAYVTGVQEGGVAAMVKHFVANDFETGRMTANVLVGERALRELYLAPFELVVKKAGLFGVMAAYNSVNGPTMTEHDELQNKVLRDEWGFDGVVVSDWTAARDTIRAALGGLDIAMPGPGTVYGPALAAAVRAGELDEEVVDEHARRVLTLARRVGALEGASRAEPLPAVDGEALAREVAAASFTLVRNDGVLPFGPDTSVALIGGAAKEARVMGGGSAQVFPSHVVSPYDGLASAGVRMAYARGADPSGRFNPARFPLRAVCQAEDGRVLGDFPLSEGAIQWLGEMPEGVAFQELRSVEITGTFTPAVGGVHRLSIEGVGRFRLVVGGQARFDGTMAPEGDDPIALFMAPPHTVVDVELRAGEPVDVRLEHKVPRSDLLSFPFVGATLGHREPSPGSDELIEEAVRVASAADVAVVVVATTKEVESEGFDRTSLKLPGRQDELVSRVAAANPRTVVVVNAGSPVEMPWREEVAAILLTWFPGQEGGHALADVVLGRTEPGGRLPTTWPGVLEECPVIDVTPVDGVLWYEEGVFVGYRAWERSGTAPAYGFGAGLGYTTWHYESAGYTAGTLTVRVRNTGDRPGREVVQVYLAPAVPDESRPARWLVGFAVAEAGPGETAEVSVEIPRRAAEVWSEHGWRLVSGDYVLQTGHSLDDIRLTTALAL
ncbi:beta-glucosidase family protein [Streptosporangium amethystogenes]|uniref:beta-glucosidase family protein n=1 Tax=Streptosporangium amethystogenes TaxID=2002 RepID=UPI000AAB1FD4|nr:glycoside hydrolase family 3 C-terminal domain-containing protein [Streptosporangium amethystogenes]